MTHTQTRMTHTQTRMTHAQTRMTLTQTRMTLTQTRMTHTQTRMTHARAVDDLRCRAVLTRAWAGTHGDGRRHAQLVEAQD
eukprot:218701-Pleurochrysis_carterae.AAC.1